MKITVRSNHRFINPWTKNAYIGNEPVPVPFDNLCRALLRDGSIERVVVKPARKEPPLRLAPKTDKDTVTVKE